MLCKASKKIFRNPKFRSNQFFPTSLLFHNPNFEILLYPPIRKGKKKVWTCSLETTIYI